MSDETPITCALLDPCARCGTLVGRESYCYGCDQYLCARCDGDSPNRRHTPAEHLSAQPGAPPGGSS